LSAEHCDICGYPLEEDGSCWNCSKKNTYLESSSPVHPVLTQREVSEIVGEPVGNKRYRALQPQPDGTNLHIQIDRLASQFGFSEEVRKRIVTEAEPLAARLVDDRLLNEKFESPKAAAVAVALVLTRQYRMTLKEVTMGLSRVQRDLGRLSDLHFKIQASMKTKMEMKMNGRPEDVKVFVNGERRKVRMKLEGGPYAWVDVPIFVEDNHAKVRVEGGTILLTDGPQQKQYEVLGPHELRVKTTKESYVLFRFMKKAAALGIGCPSSSLPSHLDPEELAKKHPITKLTFTQQLVRAAGVSIWGLQDRYRQILTRKMKDCPGRSPRKLAEEAVREACREAWEGLTEGARAEIRLIAEEMLGLGENETDGLLVPSELKRV